MDIVVNCALRSIHDGNLKLRLQSPYYVISITYKFSHETWQLRDDLNIVFDIRFLSNF